MNGFTMELNTENGKHLYEQIYAYIRKEIKEGRLLYQERLPSTRALAEHLQVSRSTVDLAYEQLLSEGYIEARPYRGYFVCKIEELYDLGGTARKADSAEEITDSSYVVDFSPNAIEMAEFPFGTWRRITRSILSGDRKELFAMGSPKGDLELRKTISRYLHASRGVGCKPEQIIVGAGNDYLLMLLQKLLGSRRRIAIENPTYKRAYRMFDSFGYEVCPISMDQSGMDVERLKESGASLAYVMPSHQFPTGIVMPIGRRTELLNWAAQDAERYLIEDDYDSEFRYRGKPIPSLQASDGLGKVIYMGTFSKSIAPAIRISYMVLPEPLLKLYEERYSFLSSTVSRIDQAILNEFIAAGHYERYLNKMRKIYREKHDLLLDGLRSWNREFVITGENAGLHLIVTDRKQRTEKELIALAAEERVKVYGIGESFVTGQDAADRRAALLLGYGGLSEAQIGDGMKRLKKAWW